MSQNAVLNLLSQLFYYHFGSHSTDIAMDIHGFYVEDGAEPPNRSTMHQFIVKIIPFDDFAPVKNGNATLQVTAGLYETCLSGTTLWLSQKQ